MMHFVWSNMSWVPFAMFASKDHHKSSDRTADKVAGNTVTSYSQVPLEGVVGSNKHDTQCMSAIGRFMVRIQHVDGK